MAGVILFAPFLDPFARFLEKYVGGKEYRASFVITPEMMKIPGASLDSLEQDTEILLYRVLPLNMEAFAGKEKVQAPPEIRGAIEERNKKLKSYDDKYDDIKRSEGELLIYALNAVEYIPEEHRRIDQLVSCIRHAMYSAKALKDVMHNRIEFRDSADDIKYKQYNDFRRQLEDYYRDITELIQADKSLQEKQFNKMLSLAHDQYFARQKNIYDAATKQKLPEEDISSLLNMNRELYTSCKTIVQALHLFYEGESNSGKIGDLP